MVFLALFLVVIAAILIAKNPKVAVPVLFFGGILLTWLANPVIGALLTLVSCIFIFCVKIVKH